MPKARKTIARVLGRTLPAEGGDAENQTAATTNQKTRNTLFVAH